MDTLLNFILIFHIVFLNYESDFKTFNKSLVHQITVLLIPHYVLEINTVINVFDIKFVLGKFEALIILKNSQVYLFV